MMIQVGRRIYFNKKTKEIVFETSDMEGLAEYVKDEGVDWDFENTMLSQHNREDIAYIQLDYMEISKLMEEHNANAYRINQSDELEFYTIEYPPSAEELKEREIKDLKVEIEKLKKDKLDLSLATAELYEKLEADKLEVYGAIAEAYEANM